MQVDIECRQKLFLELRRSADLKAVPLSSDDVTGELRDLVEEAFIRGVLADGLPAEPERVHARIDVAWAEAPVVDHLDVRVTAHADGASMQFTQTFKTGRWSRMAIKRTLQLREEDTLAEGESPYRMLVGLQNGDAPPVDPPALQAPPIIDGTLEALGVRELGEGELVPDRPILANGRMVSDSIDACVRAGPHETGGAALGAYVRLPEPLPNTSTRIVTLLTTCIEDNRHAGKLNEWQISPEALAESAQIAEMRGLGETVMTVIHTHGFSTECGNCNQNPACPLAECTLVSLSDYQVLETMFPGKATVMPIAGRKLGTEGKRPVMEIHAWRGGEMRPVRWRRFHD